MHSRKNDHPNGSALFYLTQELERLYRRIQHKEILRRGNFEGQQICVHLGAQKYWETELQRQRWSAIFLCGATR